VIDYEALDGAIGHNWYELDPMLTDRVKADCPPDSFGWVDAKLRDFGGLVGGDIARNADVIDANPPQLVRYDRWSGELGRIDHPGATIDSKRKLWAAGYVSDFAADEARHGQPAPGVMLAAANYLLSQADTGMVCSLGMTSGVAGLVDAYAPADMRDDMLSRLRSDDFDRGADGSMFLTERDGGSDLGRTVRCVARDIGDGRVLISGEKWFCSNIDGEAIVLLARPEGGSEGSAGIGLYLVPSHLEDGTPNRFTKRRLKPKLGTRSVPTGEVELDGALGYALRPRRADGTSDVSDLGGLNRMMEMVNGSRFGVALMGLGIARRSFLEAAVWAHHREAKGRVLVVRARSGIHHELRGGLGPTVRGLGPVPSGDGARHQGPAVPARRGGLHLHRRTVRRQRVLRGLGTDPAPARRGVPPDLGGQREHLRPRRGAGHPP